MDSTLLDERLVRLRDVSKLLPTKPHPGTVHRWRLRGIRGVTLETQLIGGVRYTSHEALDRFLRNSTAAAEKQGSDKSNRVSDKLGETGSSPATPSRPPGLSEATRILDRAGISKTIASKEVQNG